MKNTKYTDTHRYPNGYKKAAETNIDETFRRVRSEIEAQMDDPLKPTPTLLVKFGSIIAHMEELTSDPEVVKWLATMNKMAFLPVKQCSTPTVTPDEKSFTAK